MKRMILFSLAAFSLLFASTRADAGMKSEWGSCGTYSNGTSYCSGNFLGFRNHTDPNAYAQFFEGSSTRSFGAYLNGKYYICQIKPNVGFENVWTAAMSNRGHFYVTIMPDGYCGALQVANNSGYSNY